MKTVCLFLLLCCFAVTARAEKMTDVEAGLRLEKFLGEEELYKEKQGRVAYQITDEYIMEIWNMRYFPKERAGPAFFIWFSKNQKKVSPEFGLNYWSDRLSESVDVEVEGNKITIRTSYNTLTLVKRGEGDFNADLKSVKVEYPNGWKKTYEDNLRVVGGTCSGALGNPHTRHSRNGVASSSNYSAPPAAPSFWSSVFR